MAETYPAYLALGVDEIRRRAAEAVRALARCEVCPRNCRINRLEDEIRVCSTGRYARVSTWFAHFGEEDCLRGTRGSGTIFFSFCNLKCVFCFHPSTFVSTGNGLIRIGELFDACESQSCRREGWVGSPNDLAILTRQGTSTRVRHVFSHDFHGQLLRVKAYSCPPLLLTPNHRVFAAHRSELEKVVQLRADELTRDHFLIVPKRQLGNRAVRIDVQRVLLDAATKTRKRRQRRHLEGDLVAALESDQTSEAVGAALGYDPTYVRLLRAKHRSRKLSLPTESPIGCIVERDRVRFMGERRPGLPRSVELDENLAWLLGIFCAEGHVRRSSNRPSSSGVIFSFGRHESELVERTRKLLSEIFGVRSKVVPRRTTTTVECYRASLGAFFKALCGTGAANKQVPVELLRSREGVIRAFLRGYMAGDGCEVRNQISCDTVSEKLAFGLFEIGLHLGMLPSFFEWKTKPTTLIEGRRVRQSTLYYVKFKCDRLNKTANATKERTKWKERDNVFLTPVHRVERIPYHGPVYNLEVEDADHSYLAPFAAVANCQNHDTSQAGHGREMRPEDLANAMLDLQTQGCHNINFVTPEHVVPEILEALPIAIERGLRLPIVYNTSAYDAMESLAWMDGIVDIYMPDFKVWTKPSAIRYLKAKDYRDVACRVVREMHRQVGPLELDRNGMARRGVLVRHLVMPGLLAESEEIFRFLATEISPDTYVNVMGQYRPEYRTSEYPEIDRRPTASEMEEARRLFWRSGLRRLDQRRAGRLNVLG